MTSEYKYDEFVNKMHHTYPKIFDYPYGGIAVNEGWWPIIESLCHNIQSHIDFINTRHESLLADNPHGLTIPEEIPQVVVHQIKEKFGELRFYYGGGDQYVKGLVTMAEAWAELSCEICGAPGVRRDGGWIKTLCDHHYKSRG